MLSELEKVRHGNIQAWNVKVLMVCGQPEETLF